MGIDPATQKRLALERAIRLVTAPSDISTLLDLYTSQPLILDVFVLKPDWDSNPQVVAFLAANIDNITTAYRTSNVATKSLLTLLDRSADTNVQSKFSNFLFNITQEPIDGHLALDLVTTYLGAGNPNPVLAQNLPNVFTALADHVVSASDKDTSDTKVLWPEAYNPLATELHQNFKTFLALASNSTTRDALHRIAQIIRRDSNDPADNASNLLSAICGDQEAFKKVVASCQSESMAGPHSIALDYLKTVQGADASNIVQSINANLANAVYNPNTSKWSIPSSNP